MFSSYFLREVRVGRKICLKDYRTPPCFKSVPLVGEKKSDMLLSDIIVSVVGKQLPSQVLSDFQLISNLCFYLSLLDWGVTYTLVCCILGSFKLNIKCPRRKNIRNFLCIFISSLFSSLKKQQISIKMPEKKCRECFLMPASNMQKEANRNC